MREESLERLYEKQMNRLDEGLMDGSYTQPQYEQKVADLDRWMDSWLELISKKSTTNGVNYE